MLRAFGAGFFSLGAATQLITSFRILFLVGSDGRRGGDMLKWRFERVVQILAHLPNLKELVVEWIAPFAEGYDFTDIVERHVHKAAEEYVGDNVEVRIVPRSEEGSWNYAWVTLKYPKPARLSGAMCTCPMLRTPSWAR